MQTPLGAFPQAADAMQLRPEGATRFAGYFRIVNEGAVRLEVVQASGLSQISPEQFPESDATRAALRVTGSQRFAYRFSGADFALRIQADQILPELSVSQVLAYHLGENELAIDGEIELDIREAPLRELLLRVPKGYAIARLNASGLSDYFLREPDEQPDDCELRLVYGQPVSGRQVVQLRLERNQPLGEATWALPRIEVAKAKSVRGHVARGGGRGLSPDGRAHAGADRNRHRLLPAQSRRHPGRLPAERPGLAGDAARRTAAADRAGRCVPSLLHRRRHRLRQQRDELRGLRRAGVGLQGRAVRRILQRRVHRQGHPQLAEDRRRLRGATAHAGLGRLHAAGHLRAALQGAGRDAHLHRRAPARRAIRAGLHPRHQRLSVPGEARRMSRPACCRSRPAKCRPNTACSSTRPSSRPIATRRARSISSSRSARWRKAIRSARSWTARRSPRTSPRRARCSPTCATS